MDKQDVVYSHNGMLFSLKRNEIVTHAMSQIDLENTMLSEISKTQKDRNCTIPVIWRTGPFIDTEIRIDIYQALRQREVENYCLTGTEFVWDDEKVPKTERRRSHNTVITLITTEICT